MHSSAISVADQELLEEFHQALAASGLAVGAEFQQEMQHCGFNEDRVLANFFSGMLLEEGDLLIKARFGGGGGPDSRQIIALFDSYLSCLARRASSVLSDAGKTRRTLEALRRIAFHYMIMAVESYEAATRAPQVSELFDGSTGMLNQEGFLAALGYLLEDEANHHLALIMLELDYGMSTPDDTISLQQGIAQRLLQVAREGDIVARLTPQRWAIGLCQIKSVAQANLAALKLKRQFEEAFVISDRTVTLLSRIGIAMAPDHGNRAEQLQRAALKAARWSVHSDQNIQIYSPAIDLEHAQSRHLGVMLRKALSENALNLHYQPQFSVVQNRVVGLEALLRWDSPEGQIPPVLMLEAIEHEGLVPQLTQWLIHTAFRHFAGFRREGIDTRLSINLLPQNFSQEEFPDIVAQALDVWKVPADRITLEITENSVLDDIEATIKQIARLKKIGFGIAMDNFGTGYSSMSYLSKLEIDELKIDQSFVRAMPSSPRDRTIVRAIANLATSFDLTLVAVGVETEDISASLKEFNCDIIQGYLICGALPPDAIINWWKQRPQ